MFKAATLCKALPHCPDTLFAMKIYIKAALIKSYTNKCIKDKLSYRTKPLLDLGQTDLSWLNINYRP